MGKGLAQAKPGRQLTQAVPHIRPGVVADLIQKEPPVLLTGEHRFQVPAAIEAEQVLSRPPAALQNGQRQPVSDQQGAAGQELADKAQAVPRQESKKAGGLQPGQGKGAVLHKGLLKVHADPPLWLANTNLCGKVRS